MFVKFRTAKPLFFFPLDPETGQVAFPFEMDKACITVFTNSRLKKHVFSFIFLRLQLLNRSFFQPLSCSDERSK